VTVETDTTFSEGKGEVTDTHVFSAKKKHGIFFSFCYKYTYHLALNICENVSTFLDLRSPEEMERDLKNEVKNTKKYIFVKKNSNHSFFS
jgi:hypothetical protein